MSVKAINDIVIIEKQDHNSTTATGLHLVSAISKDVSLGTVISAGNGMLLENGSRAELSVKNGDKVCFKNFGSIQVKEDGKDLVAIRESDILYLVC